MTPPIIGIPTADVTGLSTGEAKDEKYCLKIIVFSEITADI
tara:strand:+ start:105 stop:227 length:123 start_codon:yes stop_codon:yes gene_type:complete